VFGLLFKLKVENTLKYTLKERDPEGEEFLINSAPFCTTDWSRRSMDSS